MWRVRVSGLPKSRIIGMAGVLDSASMRTFIAAELSVPGPRGACDGVGRTWRYDGAAAALYDGEGVGRCRN